jgi:hypothetical protein
MALYVRYPAASGGSSSSGIQTYPDFASFPASAADGAVALALDTDFLYAFNTGSNSWVVIGGPGTTLSVGTIDTGTPSADGAQISANQLIMQSASDTKPGLVNLTTQTFKGDKTIDGNIAANNLSGTNSGDVTLTAVGAVPNANGASLSGQALTLQPADATHPGALTAADWNTFNNKQSALTLGDLTESTSSILTITGGTGAVVGSGTSVKANLSSGNIYVGNASNVAASVTMSGDVTIDNAGATTIGANKVTNSKLATMAANTVKANITGGAASPTDVPLVSANTVSSAVFRDSSGNFSAGTITANLTGTASGNTTYSANNHGVVVSSATNAMTVIAPNASTNLPLVSGGTGADPSWAVLPIAGGGTGQTSAANAINALLPTQAGNNGKFLTTDGSVASWANAGMPWSTVTGASQSMSVNNGYIANRASLVTFTLPATSVVGDMVSVVGQGTGGWQISQNAGQIITVNTQQTSPGVGGYIYSGSGANRTTVDLICVTASTEWQVLYTFGTISIPPGFQGSTAGYGMGGSNGSDLTNISKLLFSSEVASSLSATLGTAVSLSAGVSSTVKGYVMGGLPGTSAIQALTFSGETTSTLGATLSAARQRGTGLSSSTKGYHCGGQTSPVSAIEALTFVGETIATIAATLSPAVYQAGGGCSLSKGYLLGGNNGSSPINSIQALTYAGETISSIAGTLPSSIEPSDNVVSSTAKAYSLGASSATTAIVAFDFTSETASTLSAVLTNASRNAGGVSGTTKGYTMGGNVSAGTPDNYIQSFIYSSEASGVLAATLGTAKYSATGVQY